MAHKVVTNLIADGLLEVHAGIGTVVTKQPLSTAAERANLLKQELEQLVVEARKLGLAFEDVAAALDRQWKRLDGSKR